MKLFFKNLVLIGVLTFAANCSKKKEVSEKSMENVIGLDIRTTAEIITNPAPGSIHLEMSELPDQMETRFPDKTLSFAVFCEAGGRAEKVKAFLIDKGYKNIENIGSWREWNVLQSKK